MQLVQREDWGAPASSPAGYLASARGVKIHYLGSAYSSRKHSLCDDYVRSIRASHLANTRENYIDIAYTAVVCEHGTVYEGRGTHKRPGANGTAELNGRDYAVCALLAKQGGGLDTPSDAMLHGLRDAIEWLRRAGDAGDWIGGHRDGHATTCPGDALYAWVKKGAPRPDGDRDEQPDTPDRYTVRAGDSLAVIARRLNVDWPDLAKANGIRAPYTIYPGQKLHVPARDDEPVAPAFPGAAAFRLGRRNSAVTALDKRLIAKGFAKHHDGNGYQPGPLFSEYTRRNVADFQRSRAELRGDPDGYPGSLTWRLLHS